MSPPEIEFGLGDSESDMSCSQGFARVTAARGYLTSGSLAGHRCLFTADQQQYLAICQQEDTASVALSELFQTENLLVKVARAGQILDEQPCFEQTVEVWHPSFRAY